MMKLLTTVVGALLVLSIGLYADFNKTLTLEGITFHISAVRSDMGGEQGCRQTRWSGN